MTIEFSIISIYDPKNCILQGLGEQNETKMWVKRKTQPEKYQYYWKKNIMRYCNRIMDFRVYQEA